MPSAVAAPSGGRRARRALVAAAVLLPPLLVYLPHLGEGFVSEDFLLIALHRESPPWRDLVATFSQPWLGMRLFEFYRPLAAIAFAAEAALFGAASAGYDVVHLALHLVATWLVWQLLRTLLSAPDSRRPSAPVAAAVGGRSIELAALAGALFFALYPLAPNAVLFTASFATLFGAVATLASALLYARWTGRGAAVAGAVGATGPARRFPTAALAAYAIALGCYESSVALPLWLAVLALVRGAEASPRARVALAPFCVLALGYLALRVALFGDPLGGYLDVAGRLRGIDAELALAALRSSARLPAPWFALGPGPAVEILAGVVVVAAAAAWLATARSGAARALLGVLGLGAAWVAVFLAPFGYALPSPAVGRYGYLAAAGAAMAMAAVIARAGAVASPARRRAAAAIAGIAVAALLARNTLQLRRHLAVMDEAAAVASRIADEIARVARDGEPFFVADYPLFLRGAEGANWAQVYHYGLRAAAGPPFRERAADVYPLPSSAEGDPRRLALVHPVYRWVDAERALRRLGAAPAEGATEPPLPIGAGGPADGASISLEDGAALQLRVPAVAGARAHVVVSAPGNYTIAGPAGEGGGMLELPVEFLRLWADLAPGPQLWWVEHRDAAGRAVAQSEPRWLIVRPDGRRNHR